MTNFRKTYLLTLPLLSLLSLAANAQSPVATSLVTVDCEHRYISQRDAARVLRTDNFSQTYAKRQSLYANVARACHGGVKQVLLVAEGRPDSRPKLASR